MSRHGLCALASTDVEGTRSHLVIEGRKMVFEASEAQAGDMIGTQIRRAAENLELEFWFVWRAWRGRIGKRAFPILKGAYLRYVARRSEKAERDNRALAERLDRMERRLAGDYLSATDSSLQGVPLAGRGLACARRSGRA